MKRTIHTALIVTALAIAGCEKAFLKSEHTGYTTLSNTGDYDLLLNADALALFPSWPLIQLLDDVEHTRGGPNMPANQRLYTWQDDVYGDQNPSLWTAPYKSIHYFNLVINEVEAAGGTDAAKKKQLKAEALLGRAFSHWMLAGLFSKTYQAGSAAADPGIPYVTSTDMYAPNPGRGTVQGMLQQILADVDAALPSLPDKSSLNHRGSKAAAYAFLSRVHLFCGQYGKTIEYAGKALALENTLRDYNSTGYTRLAEKDNPEYIYLRMVYDVEGHGMQFTPAFSALLPATDRRRELYGVESQFALPDKLHPGLTVQEVMLNMAEALVRQPTPDIPAALALVNKINANRDKAHQPLYTTDTEQALAWVLLERRRELVFTGLRWFDMRRLAREGRMPVVTRRWAGQTYTLPPDSKKYTLLIPAAVMLQNPGMQQNER